MTGSTPPASPFSLRTAWARSLKTPLRRFVRTETGSSAILLAATVAALAWANIDPAGYAATWHTVLVVRSGTNAVADTWQGWVNSGSDGALLPGGGPGGAPEVRHGRAARAAAACSPACCRIGRDDRTGRDLAGGQRRPCLGIRLGRRHVHGHCLRAGLLALIGPGIPNRPRRGRWPLRRLEMSQQQRRVTLGIGPVLKQPPRHRSHVCVTKLPPADRPGPGSG